jgi:hypothetical protein
MAVERLRRKAALGWAVLDKMRVREEISQRKFRPAWANTIYKGFDLEKFGVPVVNRIGDWYWIIDGQHRIAALKMWLNDWSGQKIECWVYHNLSEQEEADMFLALNNVRAIKAFDKFRAALTAGHEDPTNIAAIVRKNKLKISEQKNEGCISCVGTLAKVYRRGAHCLDRDLKIVYESFGDVGLDADILDGIGVLVSRYDGQLDDARMIQALSKLRGSVNTIRARAGVLRKETGVQRAHCIAAAAVECHNRGKGGKKLPTWWKATAE